LKREEALERELREKEEEVYREPLSAQEKHDRYRSMNPTVPEDEIPCFIDDPEPTPEMGPTDPPGEMGPPSPPADPPIENILRNPQSLQGQTPESLLNSLGGLPNGWRQETLRQGSQRGNGLILREYLPNGRESGRMIQWHPGGGHHGPAPYWKVSSPSGGTVRIQ
jgi:hypothetical protein